MLICRWLFCNANDVAAAWGARFDVVQVDEMQDTHVSEYSVLRRLALASGNLVLAGDFDQTIYG